jgi:hypothetical protein
MSAQPEEQLLEMLAHDLHASIAASKIDEPVCLVCIMHDVDELEETFKWHRYPHPSLFIGTASERASFAASYRKSLASKGRDLDDGIYNPAEYSRGDIYAARGERAKELDRVAGEVTLGSPEAWRAFFVRLAQRVGAMGLEEVLDVTDDFCTYTTDCHLESLQDCFRAGVPAEIRATLVERNFLPRAFSD